MSKRSYQLLFLVYENTIELQYIIHHFNAIRIESNVIIYKNQVFIR